MKLYKICTQCKYFCRKEEKDEFCSNCGTQLITKCQECGEDIDNPYAEHCKKCGRKYREIKIEKNLYNF